VVSVTPRPRFTHCTGGWVGLKAGVDSEDRGKNPVPLLCFKGLDIINHQSSSVIHYDQCVSSSHRFRRTCSLDYIRRFGWLPISFCLAQCISFVLRANRLDLSPGLGLPLSCGWNVNEACPTTVCSVPFNVELVTCTGQGGKTHKVAHRGRAD
jgi:hypothetical protein